MSTPPNANEYRITWLPTGDRPVVHTHTVEAAGIVASPEGFTTLNDADGLGIFTINNAFLVSIERTTEKG